VESFPSTRCIVKRSFAEPMHLEHPFWLQDLLRVVYVIVQWQDVEAFDICQTVHAGVVPIHRQYTFIDFSMSTRTTAIESFSPKGTHGLELQRTRSATSSNHNHRILFPPLYQEKTRERLCGAKCSLELSVSSPPERLRSCPSFACIDNGRNCIPCGRKFFSK
jgi:hypothetical protein